MAPLPGRHDFLHAVSQTAAALLAARAGWSEPVKEPKAAVRADQTRTDAEMHAERHQA